MLPFEHFRHCPKCAAAVTSANPLRCGGCGFVFFFNPTVAAGAFIFDEHERVILIRRANPPKKGMLGVPGGFLDIGETAEAGLAREVKEEVGLEIEGITFLCSEPNEYEFDGINYPVCDLMFTAKAINAAQARLSDEATRFDWFLPCEIPLELVAFASVRKGLKHLCQSR